VKLLDPGPASITPLTGGVSSDIVVVEQMGELSPVVAKGPPWPQTQRRSWPSYWILRQNPIAGITSAGNGW
jgi:hypothetical protein